MLPELRQVYHDHIILLNQLRSCAGYVALLIKGGFIFLVTIQTDTRIQRIRADGFLQFCLSC